jgi:uncharacterized protein
VREERDRRAAVSNNGQRPTFDCARAIRAVEKAICSDADLARLDRQIDDAYKAALGQLNRSGVARLRREQRAFIARRDKAFGRPDYQLKREMERRLQMLRGMTTAN